MAEESIIEELVEEIKNLSSKLEKDIPIIKSEDKEYLKTFYVSKDGLAIEKKSKTCPEFYTRQILDISEIRAIGTKNLARTYNKLINNL